MITKNINNSMQLPKKSVERPIHKGKKIIGKLAITIASLSVFAMQSASAACDISPNDSDEFIRSIYLNGSTLSSGMTLKDDDVLELTPGYSDYAYKDDWSVWLDLNNDGDFSDSNEMIFSTSSPSNSMVSAVLAIPSNVNVSNTEMRVVLHSGNINSDSCNFNSYGDSKDFSVNVGNDTDGSGSDDYALSQQPRGGSSEHILSIEIDNDKRTTGDDNGYADFTSDQTFNVNDGDLITLTPTTSWGTDWAVWIDSDNNGNFDNDEQVFSGSGSRNAVVEGTLDLNGISSGTARMRIAMNGDGNADADGFKYGEIEDYMANVQSGGPDTGTDDDKNYGPHVQWEHDSVHIKVFRFKFSDVDLKWSENRIKSEMGEIKDYFKKDSYGRFEVTYEIYDDVIQVGDKLSVWDNKTSNDWKAYYADKLVDLGEKDFWDIDDNTIYLILAPQISSWNEDNQEWVPYGAKAGVNPGAMRFYDIDDERSQAGGIAHEMGHAMGLHHAQGLDGQETVFGVGDYDNEMIGYGNYFSMMGNNAWDFGGFNLYYKNFFKSWDIKAEVPLVSKSDTYTIHALDQGSVGGNLGIRLKAGNGDVTYWVEYRTEDGADTNGVLINTEGYFPDEDARSYYYGTSFLLDMTPNTHPDDPSDDYDDFDDFIDGALTIGNSYTDKWGAFTITTKRTGGTSGTASAWIEVEVTMH